MTNPPKSFANLVSNFLSFGLPKYADPIEFKAPGDCCGHELDYFIDYLSDWETAYAMEAFDDDDTLELEVTTELLAVYTGANL